MTGPPDPEKVDSPTKAVSKAVIKQSQAQPATFKVDNQLIQTAAQLYGSQRVSPQLYLPGLAPFGPFDYWATLALYALLDPQQPSMTVRTSYTELLQVLDFSRQLSNALMGYETYPSDAYRLVEDSLQRLFSVEVQWRHLWEVRSPGKGGKPRKQWVDFRGRILSSYAYLYPPGVTPPSLLPAAERKNANRAKDKRGDPGPPIYKRAAGPRPVGVEIGLAPELVRGLTGEDPHIGATIMPLHIFKLRPSFGPYPTATRLLVWVCRQTARTTTRRLDGLVRELDLRGKDPGRNRETILLGFEMLRAAGVVEAWQVKPGTATQVAQAAEVDGLEDGAEPVVTFTKATGWHFSRTSREEEV